jgi:cysteine desulfurase / selenocysteine lyase
MSTSELSLGQALAGAGSPLTGGAIEAPAGSVALGALPAAAAPGQELGRLLEQLANQYLSGVPGPALELGRDSLPGGVAIAGGPAPAPVAPPSSALPSATSVGAGGFSPGAGWVPPTPGVLQSPPIASGPLPKESDLRTIPAMLSEGLGISSPVAAAGGLHPSGDVAPYFLQGLGAGSGLDPRGVASVPLVPGAGVPAPILPPGPAPWRAGSEAPPSEPPYFMQIAGLPKPPPETLAAPFGGARSQGFAPLASAPGVSPGALGSSASLPVSGAPSAPLQPSASSTGHGASNNAFTPGTSPGISAPLAGQPSQRVPHGAAASSAARTPDPGNFPRPLSFDPSEVSLSPFAHAAPGGSGNPHARATASNERRLFDAASVRRDFPILRERVHNKELVWLDNAATTQKPRAVIERLSHFYEHENSNIHRAAHALAARATDAYEGARETVRRFINAPSVGEIIFVRGTTEGINLVAQSWGRRHLNSGDEVVITWLEHHANIVPWQLICSERGARLRVAPVDDDGQVLIDEYEKLLGARTKFVSMSHVSNALGTIVPVTEMVAMAHRHGAKVLVDGAQAVSHMPVDVQAIDADFYVFSGHKIFGPTGIGAVFGKAAVLETMPPYQGGGNMIRDVTFERTQFQGPPARFEAGTPNIADAVGLGAALDYVSSLGMENISLHEHELLVYASERLTRIPGLHLYGTAREKAGVLSFTIDGLKTEDIGVALDREGIAVRAGHHCAQPILRRFGQESTVRASLAPYNTYDDVDALVAALQRLLVMRQ